MKANRHTWLASYAESTHADRMATEIMRFIPLSTAVSFVTRTPAIGRAEEENRKEMDTLR